MYHHEDFSKICQYKDFSFLNGVLRRIGNSLAIKAEIISYCKSDEF